MKEIKFRAWSESDKVMFYPRCSDSFMYLIADKPSPVYPEFKDVIQQGHLQSWMNRQNYIMQYTGLKDKNGKEIYDLDFLGETLGLYISWCDKCHGWQLFHDGDDCFSCSGDIHLRDCEEQEFNVIGNILENTELIK
jgi:hypothetical protein